MAQAQLQTQLQTPLARQPMPTDDLALKNARLGLVLWRIANGLAFVFFAFANALMRSVQPSWPPPGVERLEIGLPIVVTGVLLLSGLFASRALASVRRGDLLSMQRHIMATLALGVVFFVGIVAVSLRIPYSGPYSSIIIAMNAFHALHVVVGMLLLVYVLRRAGKGVYSAEGHWSVEASVIFWHFVDLMWLFFFVVIYVV